MKLGTAIKSIRVKQGLAQNELAKLCGITQTYLSQIENNLREPNISVLKSISAHLKIPLPILFFLSMDEGDIEPSKREAFRMLDGPVKTLINEFFHLDNTEKK